MPPKGLDKWHSNAIRLRTPHRSQTGYQTHTRANSLRLVSRIGGCIITRPLLNVIRNQINQLKHSFNHLHHQIWNHLSLAPQNACDSPIDFPTTMMRGKNAANALSIPTGNIKNIRTLWPINDQDFYSALMKTRVFLNMNLHQKIILFNGGGATENCSCGIEFQVGTMPLDDGIVVDLNKMNKIIKINEEALTRAA